MTSQLIIALDFDKQHEALSLVDQIDPSLCSLKVGSEMFTSWGSLFVKQLINRQFKVFLDLKFHDIPNTVAKACAAAAELGVWMLNVHAQGGSNMMEAAVKSLSSYGQNKPILIAVTVLTSFTDTDLNEVGVNAGILDHVLKLAQLAQRSGLDGVVCSAQEVRAIKNLCGTQFLTVTPGIRLPDNVNNDQSRIMTPKKAIREGSDYLVIGRPITRALNPVTVISDILKSLS
jgi:orotidine-5'-phosphate decarboxylase